MTYELSFELPGLPKTTNSGGRAHWAMKVREANSWKRAVYVTIRSRLPLAPCQRATLTLTRMSSSEPDFDGLVSSFKHVIDGLVEAGVLVSDKPSVIGQPIYKWERAPRGQGRIKVTVRGEG